MAHPLPAVTPVVCERGMKKGIPPLNDTTTRGTGHGDDGGGWGVGEEVRKHNHNESNLEIWHLILDTAQLLRVL